MIFNLITDILTLGLVHVLRRKNCLEEVTGFCIFEMLVAIAS